MKIKFGSRLEPHPILIWTQFKHCAVFLCSDIVLEVIVYCAVSTRVNALNWNGSVGSERLRRARNALPLAFT